MGTTETKGSLAIAEKMAGIEPGTPRYDTLEVARNFKVSWVQLGEKLWDVRRARTFADWGFGSFEEYCQQELRLKPPTVDKLMASYGFMKKEGPSVLKRDGIREAIPDIQVVEMLRKVKEEQGVSEQEYRKVRDMAFDNAPINALRKELRQINPPEPPAQEQVLQRLAAQVDRLVQALSSLQKIPKVVVERAKALADDLRELQE